MTKERAREMILVEIVNLDWDENQVAVLGFGVYEQGNLTHEGCIFKMYSAVCKAFNNMKKNTSHTKEMCSTSLCLQVNSLPFST